MTATADATDSSTVEQLITTVENLQETVEQQAERINQLETELAEHKDHTGREFADVRARITEAENQQMEAGSEDATPGVKGEETGSQTSQTPLERICSLPEHVADRELTANQERARFIAKDVRDYAEKAPAGLVVDSRTIKKVVCRCRRKAAPHADSGSCHGFPRGSRPEQGGTHQASRQEAHRRGSRGCRPARSSRAL